MRSRMSGSARVFTTSAWILFTTAGGVFAGAMKPNQAVTSNPGTVSAIGGSSGARVARRAGDAQAAKPARLHVRQQHRCVVEHHFDLAAEDVGGHLRARL